jgi:hypothetical protein
LRNHWRLEDRFVALGGLDGSGPHGPTAGSVRIHGPLGLSRMAKTRVLAAEAPGSSGPGTLSGRADVGPGTVGRVAWTIERNGEGSLVTLSAAVEVATWGDRALLALGGRRWLERLFANAVQRLAGLFEDSA